MVAVVASLLNNNNTIAAVIDTEVGADFVPQRTGLTVEGCGEVARRAKNDVGTVDKTTVFSC